MKFTNAPYTDTDEEFAELREFLIEGYAQRGEFGYFSVSRFENWQYRIFAPRLLKEPDFLTKIARVWRDENGKVAAFATTECDTRFFDLLVECRSDCRELEAEVHGWRAETISGRDLDTAAFVFETDDVRKNALTEAGFEYAGSDGFVRKFDLATVETAYDLPDGVVIVDVTAAEDIKGHYSAISKGFNPGYEWTDSDYHYWESTHRAPSYRSDLDISVVAADGVNAAGLVAWVDEKNAYAELEPVATHHAYQRRGFGRAVIKEAFTRLKRLGVKYAYVGHGIEEPRYQNRFYDSLGPKWKFHMERWMKR